jgi:ABC-type uncharacterized transport system involved in gliding motility auxiliary subunit
MTKTKTKKYRMRFWKISGSLAGLLVLLALLIAANLIVGAARLRKDMTEDQLYTLSDNTRRILQQLDQPVTLKFFFNSSAPEIPMPLKYFAQQVEDLLHEYRLAGGGRILMENYNPEPDSDAEEWAERYGVAAQNLGMIGPRLYLGLAAVCGDVHTVIPFIDPRDEAMLEYNITRMIVRVTNPAKPVIGLISSLPVMGIQQPMPFVMGAQPPTRGQPPWAAFSGLADDYEIRELTLEVEEIPADVDALLLVHPKKLSDQAQYAIDQFVLRGGRVLAFIDPLCLADAQSQDKSQMMMGMPPQTSSDLGRLTQAWGLEWDADQVLMDINSGTRVRQGDSGVEDSPLFLTLRSNNFRRDDLLMTRLDTLIMPMAGVFRGSAAEGLTMTPLILSSEQSKTVPNMMAQMGGDMVRRDFQPGLERLPIAVRLHGNFKTAFPDGKPIKADADADANAPSPTEKTLQASVQPTTVILVGDVDMLYDHFCVQEINLFGYRGYQPINDNLNLFANALEQLSGAVELAEIRTRGRIERPFDRVLALQQEAQQRWMLQERALQEKLEATRERLNALQSRKDQNQRYILSAEQEDEVRRFKAEQLRTQRELKQVRKNLREGIERLGVKVKVINILLMPILVGLAGIIFAWHRRRRASLAAAGVND